LHQRLLHNGWLATTNSDWEAFDLKVHGPGPVRLTLTSVYEEDLEHARHYVRYRIEAKRKPWSLLQGFLLACLLLICLTKVYLWPLALPLAAALYWMARAPRIQTNALAQLAMECAEPLGMIPAKELSK
jgi:hypothetical protein